MRQDVQVDEEYTLLKLNDQHMKDDVSIRQEYLNTWKTKSYMEITQILYRKKMWAESSLSWFSAGYIYPEMEGFAVAIQDRVLRTRNYEKHC